MLGILCFFLYLCADMDEFLKYLSSEKRYSMYTVEGYENDLKQFEAYLKSAFEIEDLSVAETPHIRNWLVELVGDGFLETTVNRKLTSLKSYYRYLFKQGKIEVNPMSVITFLKRRKRLPVYVEERQISKLLSETYDPNDFENILNRTVVEFLYATGLRVSELVNLKIQDVNLSQKTIKVLGKGNKERIVPLTETISSLLQSYLDSRPASYPNENLDLPLFIDLKNKPLTQQKVYQITRRFLSSTPVDKRGPHVLRHTFATHLLNHGADIIAIKDLLGHSSLAATQVYTHNSIEKLKQAYQTAHPRA
jgi:integrase/recombinase XerC